MTSMNVVFESMEPQADNISTFWFKPEKTMSYTAGQFVELVINHQDPDERGEKRWFTLSSPPGSDLISITTKFSQPSSSFKRALQNLTAGTKLKMSEPMGDFVLPKSLSQPLVFVAGGIGLTPFHSMLEWLATAHQERQIKFIYAVRNENEIIFQNTFQKAGVHAVIVVKQPSASWGGEQGQLTAELICGLTNPTSNSLVYLSGPEPMVEHLSKDLKNFGLKSDQIVTDFFPGYSDI